MNKTTLKLFYMVSILGIITQSGCASKGGVNRIHIDQSSKQDVVDKIPASSPLSKINIGMSISQVNDLIGEPDDQSRYPTVNTFIPFYFGNDRLRVEYYYKGQGRIIFKGGSGLGFGGDRKVYSITYDPSDNG